VAQPTGIQLLAALDSAADELGQAMAVLAATGLDPAATTVGAGDRALLALVVALTGSALEVTVPCPRCGTVNSIMLTESAVSAYEPRTRWFAPGSGVREPTYADLGGLPADERDAAAALGYRCTVGQVELADAIAALADVDGSLAGPIECTCVGCATPMFVEADVEQLALDRLRAAADDVDREIDLLASRYRWELATIEALPDRRRRRLAQLAVTR
jgi:hypothetical protein